MTEEPVKKKTDFQDVARASSMVYQVGFTLVGSIVFFMFLGHLLDKWLKINMFFVGGGMFGALAGLYFVYKMVDSLYKE